LEFSYRSSASGDDDDIVKRGHKSSSREVSRALIIDARAREMLQRGLRGEAFHSARKDFEQGGVRQHST
jgi:hypothetical protein